MAYDPNATVENLPVDQTASRAMNTTYQNTTGRPLRVQVTLHCDTGTTGTSARGDLYVGSAADPTADAANIAGSFGIANISTSIEIVGIVEVVVPVNYYYHMKANAAGIGSAVSVFSSGAAWRETTL